MEELDKYVNLELQNRVLRAEIDLLRTGRSEQARPFGGKTVIDVAESYIDLQQKLAIAVEALEAIKFTGKDPQSDYHNGQGEIAKEALKKIKGAEDSD